MKTIFFIDGENFVYQLRDSLAKARLIKYRDELVRVDIRKLFENTLQDPSVRNAAIKYYAAKVHIIEKTPELKERTERYAADATTWRTALESQKVEYVEAGHLLVRDGKPCVECGHREPVLVEKGVDVTIATDLIRSSGDNVRLVLLSSDGDLMPAVEEAKRRGAELYYVGFRGVSNAALARIATKRFTIASKNAAAVLGPPLKKVEAEAPAESQSHAHDTGPATQPHTHDKPAKQTRGKQNNRSQNRKSNATPPSVFTGSALGSMLPSLPVKTEAKPATPRRLPKKQDPQNG